MAESSLNRWKTLWEKEKLLVVSNFSLSRSVFKRIVMQTRKNQGLFRKRLNGLIMVTSIIFLHITALSTVSTARAPAAALCTFSSSSPHINVKNLTLSFSPSNNLATCDIKGKFWNIFTLYCKIQIFNDLRNTLYEKIVGKVENAGNQHFLLFPQSFLFPPPPPPHTHTYKISVFQPHL